MMSEKHYWIVWNADRSEGVVFDGMQDASECSANDFSAVSSTLGEAFRDLYDDDDDLPLQMVTFDV